MARLLALGLPHLDHPDKGWVHEAQIRRVFYLLCVVQKYIVIRRVRGNHPVREDGYGRQCMRLARSLG